MQAMRQRAGRRLRRAAVVVQVAVMSTVIVGMAALAIDIGAMYTARTELQAAVDAAALAAAAQLGGDGVEDPADLARVAADQYARLNAVFGTYAGVDMQNDVEFGKAIYNPDTQRFHFESGADNFDAVRVTVKRAQGSEGGPLMLTFAHIFGKSSKDLWARAAAVLVPRDIAVVIDLSGSMNDDSELQRYQEYTDGAQVNLRDIWCALDGPAPSRPYVPGAEDQTEYAGDTGPTYGEMKVWGAAIDPDSYNPVSDPGLWYIKKGVACTEPAVPPELLARSYSSNEVSALTSSARDSSYSNQWRNRTAVILALAEWNSGKIGGRNPTRGDGDNTLEDGEIAWSLAPAYAHGWNWSTYVNWVKDNSSMVSANPNFRYRYGPKTFVNFLLENRPSYNQTDILWQTPEQPVQAVKDALQAMVDVIVALDSLDHISLETYATTPTHEINLTDNLQSIPDRLYQRQAGHYNTTTNIGGGLAIAINELLSPRARGAAAKIIVLMSDGKPNVNEDGQYIGDNAQEVIDYCLAEAQYASDQGFRIYTISVGLDANRDLMQQIAQIGHGQEFYAAGTPEEYTDQLEDIFRTLGGKRPVALIE